MTFVDVALRQQLLAQRIKLGRLPAIAQLRFNLAVECRKALEGRADDAFARMTKTEFLQLCARLNVSLSNAFGDYSEEFMEWIGSYIEFDLLVGSLLYAYELNRAVAIPDKNALLSKFNAMILPGSGITPTQALVKCSAFCVGKIVARVRLAMPNAEAPATTLEALLGGDKLRDVGSIMAPCMNAVTAIDATLVQASHITVNQTLIASA